jgi:outer membrane protein assembly factor BamB
MLGKTLALVALVASVGAISISPSLAGSKGALGTPSWNDTNANAAGSRANLAEKVLTPAAVKNVKYLRSIASPMIPANAPCPLPIAAPLLTGGYLYAITNGYLSKYDPGTGKLIWRVKPFPGFRSDYQTLSYSDNLIVVGEAGCQSASSPGGITVALNAATGARIWEGGDGAAVVVGTSYVVTENTDAAGYDLSVVKLQDGTRVWSMSSCLPSGSPIPVVVGLTVMVYGCDGQGRGVLQGRSLATGAVRWTRLGFGIQSGDLAGSAGKNFYATGPSGTVADLNPMTGQKKYSLSGAAEVLAVDASRVYASCARGKVCAYDISTGALYWKYTPLINRVTSAAEADGVLYLNDGIALTAATGHVIKKIWESITYASPTTIHVGLPSGPIAVGDGRVAVVTDPRVLDLFGLPGY